MEDNNYNTMDWILLKDNGILLFIGKDHEDKDEGFEHAREGVWVGHILSMVK